MSAREKQSIMRPFVLVAVVQLNDGRKNASECHRQISSIKSYPARSDKLRYVVCVGHGEGDLDCRAVLFDMLDFRLKSKP